MAAPRQFVSFSSTDIGRYHLMCAGKADEHIDFNFADFQPDEAITSQNPSRMPCARVYPHSPRTGSSDSRVDEVGTRQRRAVLPGVLQVGAHLYRGDRDALRTSLEDIQRTAAKILDALDGAYVCSASASVFVLQSSVCCSRAVCEAVRPMASPVGRTGVTGKSASSQRRSAKLKSIMSAKLSSPQKRRSTTSCVGYVHMKS
jgi:hypothetical protein